MTQQAVKSNNETCQVKPDKPARPASHHRNKDQNDQAELIKELSKSMNNRIPKTEGMFETSFACPLSPITREENSGEALTLQVLNGVKLGLRWTYGVKIIRLGALS